MVKGKILSTPLHVQFFNKSDDVFGSQKDLELDMKTKVVP